MDQEKESGGGENEVIDAEFDEREAGQESLVVEITVSDLHQGIVEQLEQAGLDVEHDIYQSGRYQQ